MLLQRRVQQEVVCECFILRGTLVWSFLSCPVALQRFAVGLVCLTLTHCALSSNRKHFQLKTSLLGPYGTLFFPIFHFLCLLEFSFVLLILQLMVLFFVFHTGFRPHVVFALLYFFQVLRQPLRPVCIVWEQSVWSSDTPEMFPPEDCSLLKRRRILVKQQLAPWRFLCLTLDSVFTCQFHNSIHQRALRCFNTHCSQTPGVTELHMWTNVLLKFCCYWGGKMERMVNLVSFGCACTQKQCTEPLCGPSASPAHLFYRWWNTVSSFTVAYKLPWRSWWLQKTKSSSMTSDCVAAVFAFVLDGWKTGMAATARCRLW